MEIKVLNPEKKVKVLVTETLKKIPVGITVDIMTNEVRAASVRTAALKLEQSGLRFKVTERGFMDRVRVTREA